MLGVDGLAEEERRDHDGDERLEQLKLADRARRRRAASATFQMA